MEGGRRFCLPGLPSSTHTEEAAPLGLRRSWKKRRPAIHDANYGSAVTSGTRPPEGVLSDDHCVSVRRREMASSRRTELPVPELENERRTIAMLEPGAPGAEPGRSAGTPRATRGGPA